MKTKSETQTMVIEHQPQKFMYSRAFVSSCEDGTMANGAERPTPEMLENRARFKEKAGMCTTRLVVQQVLYSTPEVAQTYDTIKRINLETLREGEAADDGSAIVHADAIVTDDERISIMLPTADCIPMVISDEDRPLIAVAHVGRHSAFVNLPYKLVRYLRDECHNFNPADLSVWLGPSINNGYHTLESKGTPWPDEKWEKFIIFNGRQHEVDLQGMVKAQLLNAGISKAHIHTTNVDTYSHEEYFSHRAATEGGFAEKGGRFVTLAALNPNKTPAI